MDERLYSILVALPTVDLYLERREERMRLRRRCRRQIAALLGILLGVLLHGFLLEPQRGAADAVDPTGAPLAAIQRLPVLVTLKLIWATPTACCLMFAFMCAMFVNMVEKGLIVSPLSER